MIPVRLREQMNLISGKEYSFYTLTENGRNYICIDCGPVEDVVSLEEALEIIARAGLKVASVEPEYFQDLESESENEIEIEEEPS